MIITSTEPSALDVSRRRLRGATGTLDAAITIGTPSEIASKEPAEVGMPDYDMLIVDEASRMPMHLALTLIGRARSIVIIGDERQMRPDEEGETLLDAARRLDLPRTSLRFHYRSKQRTLISPSNLIAYGMSLRTVPTPEIAASNGLQIAYVQGNTQQTTNGTTNNQEATAIIDHLRFWQSNRNPGSVGLITTNLTQMDLLRRSIQDQLSKQEIARLNPKEHEPFFVRSLHEVQGEERDNIIISMVYDGKQGYGKFGFFESRSGLEALNVMLSRSRSSMSIFTSYRTGQKIGETYTKGRILFETLGRILDITAFTETRQLTPRIFQEVGRRLSMKVDHLGVVLGFRFGDDTRYRAGVIMPNEDLAPDHRLAIAHQLEAVGWKTAVITEVEAKTNITQTTDLIRRILASA